MLRRSAAVARCRRRARARRLRRRQPGARLRPASTAPRRPRPRPPRRHPPAGAGAVTVDPAIPAYQKTSGVSGNLSSVGSDTMNNLMTLWGETFSRMYPNVKLQVEGQGLLDRAPRPHLGHRAVRPDVAADEADRDRRVREEVRLQADRAPHVVRRPRRLRPQGQPAREADPGPGRRHLLQDPQARGGQGRHHLGRPRPHRRLGGAADQPLRPQLRQRHLRLLQGARAEERRLQGHGQGAAGLGLGGPGRDQRPLRDRLQRHRVPDLRRASSCPWPRRTAARLSEGSYEDVVLEEVPARALPVPLRQQGARASRSTRWSRSS